VETAVIAREQAAMLAEERERVFAGGENRSVPVSPKCVCATAVPEFSS